MRRLVLSLSVLMILMVSFSEYVGASHQWPMYQANPAHTGFIPVSLDPTKFALRWEKKLGSLALNPVTAAGGRVFVSQGGWNSSAGLYALDSGSGDTLWNMSFDDVYSVNPPSYSDGKVYIQTEDESIGTYLRAYDAATGALVFRSSHSAQWEKYYAPTIYKGKVYIDGGYGGGMYSFDASSGNEDWFYKLPQFDEWTPAVDENWAYAYMGDSPGLYVIDLLAGELVFKIPDPKFGWNLGLNLTPVLGGLSDAFAINDGRLIRFDLAARDISWENAANFSGQPTVVNGTVYAIRSGALAAYDQGTGAFQWMWKAPGAETIQVTIVATNSHLFVCSEVNTYCIDLTGHTEVWSYPSVGYLSLGESTLYIARRDGTLTAIGLGLSDLYVTESIAFGIADFGQTLTQTTPISNVGDEPLEIQSIVSSSGEFAVQSPVLPITIGPHQSVSIDVQFSPVARGIRSGNLLITSNDPDEPQISVALTGRSCAIHTVTATAGGGGRISPSSIISVLDGDSLNFTITPDPGYQLVALIADGAPVGNPSIYQLTYSLSNIETDRTITADFAPYFDYFGMQQGNHEDSLVKYARGSYTQTDDISLDMTNFSPSYIDQVALAGVIESRTWYQVFSNGLFMKQIESSGLTLTFTPALPMIETPLAVNARWTASAIISGSGSGTAKITAKVSPMKLVSVPAGHFMAWPIAITLKVSGPGGTRTTAQTYWFAPYIGNVEGKASGTTIKLTGFEVGGGTITTPPPVVTGSVPASATRGGQIVIKGFQFGSAQGDSKVRIGNVECDEVTSWTDTSITCVVPSTAVSGAVTVVTDPWTSNDSVHLKVLPLATGVTPSSAKRNAEVQIQGSGFGTIPGKVKFGAGQAKIAQWGDDSITCAVPATMHYGKCSITVINSQGQSVLKGAFIVVR
jgi:outer membrane protein assembly factor BamB